MRTKRETWNPTRVDPNTDNTAAWDVTNVPNTISVISDWLDVQDPCGSDTISPLPHIWKLKHYQSLGSTLQPTGPNWFIYIAQSGLTNLHIRISTQAYTTSTTIHQATEQCIPRETVTRPINPAWTDNCRRTFKEFQRGQISKQEYNTACKHIRHVILQEQQTHWQNFLSTLNSRTNISTFCKRPSHFYRQKHQDSYCNNTKCIQLTQDKANSIAKKL